MNTNNNIYTVQELVYLWKNTYKEYFQHLSESNDEDLIEQSFIDKTNDLMKYWKNVHEEQNMYNTFAEFLWYQIDTHSRLNENYRRNKRIDTTKIQNTGGRIWL